ncbi:formate C-acetyltransferase [Anaerorhabdus furcosa]|uniref:Formate acetyltransferase n=1 Tax=Anaerorhabdus furcosa TaxID=118967 RepID=A0A1T4KKK3_9FIRM|nr:formate C-acetyltransferase [Anaerorhabdus furcosa]SJZ42930.1 formate C-acetyltransferase [Anaerorhabdus furcosa]
MTNAYREFKGNKWQESIDVRDFIISNYKEYTGDDQFLKDATARTNKLMEEVNSLLKKEHENNGVLSVDTEVITSLTNYEPGYIDKELELIVGLQTDEPLKRGVNPFGGIRMARSAVEAYGYKLSDTIEEQFKYKTTHNDGVFRAYTDEMRAARKVGLITGLPDAYGRGRIIGDYRRVALYGIDKLIEEKKKDKNALGQVSLGQDEIRQLEELYQQITFLGKLKEMAQMHGYDISKPAQNAKEAIQWTYFGYLGAIKEQNGAAMSLGRVSTFFDIYFERDIEEGTLTEEEAQELMDQFVIKLRLARHLRTPDYNELFGGDPMWITEVLGGISLEGKSLVTKSSFRMLHTLINLGSAPEPNLTILWSQKLPVGFKNFCSKISILTDSIQYENDDVMRPIYGDDYAIACCVSAMKIGKQMQFFGARCNLPKLLLLALNGGIEEKKGVELGPKMDSLANGQPLRYEEVVSRLDSYMSWLAGLYVNTMNIIHYMHDKYAYEKTQMALHDTEVERFMAFGVAGISVIADSLSAIKYAKVTPVLGENGIIEDFTIEGDFPKYGNDDDRVDFIAKELVEKFITELRKHKTYRKSIHTLSVLTITSNVVYGKKTGATPDGRKAGEAFAPGANPMHNRETNGAIAALNSVAKIPYDACRDGISNTFSIVPNSLGSKEEERIVNLVNLMDGYFIQNAHHLNVNVLNKEQLMDAYENPDKYPNLTIRVSGYAVNFHRLSREQQKEVIQRTFHTTL